MKYEVGQKVRVIKTLSAHFHKVGTVRQSLLGCYPLITVGFDGENKVWGDNDEWVPYHESELEPIED